MMTIDEAISKLRSNAIMDKYNMCGYSMEQHEQLAEWLEELKALRHEANEWRKAGYKHGYNKAIDDFIHECDKYCGFYSGDNKILAREDVLKIAEQLKVGGAE